jgi:hypothetical protein
MAKIHLIDGEKGGVGKSLFCRVLIEYFQQQKLPFLLVDADRTNPDVGLIYEPSHYQKSPLNLEEKSINLDSNTPDVTYGNNADIFTGDILEKEKNLKEKMNKSKTKDKKKEEKDNFEPIFFSEDERKSYSTDLIFERAIKEDVIVNLPAQVAPLVNQWIEKNSLLTLGQEMNVSFCKWFICTGGYDSISLFKDSLNLYQDQLQHILVRNGGLCDSWSHLEEDIDLMNGINKYKVKVIDFPKLSYRERNLIDAQKWTFSTAKNQPQLGIISKQRIKLFLDQSFAQLSSTQLIQPLSNF